MSAPGKEAADEEEITYIDDLSSQSKNKIEFNNNKSKLHELFHQVLIGTEAGNKIASNLEKMISMESERLEDMVKRSVFNPAIISTIRQHPELHACITSSIKKMFSMRVITSVLLEEVNRLREYVTVLAAEEDKRVKCLLERSAQAAASKTASLSRRRSRSVPVSGSSAADADAGPAPDTSATLSDGTSVDKELPHESEKDIAADAEIEDAEKEDKEEPVAVDGRSRGKGKGKGKGRGRGKREKECECTCGKEEAAKEKTENSVNAEVNKYTERMDSFSNYDPAVAILSNVEKFLSGDAAMRYVTRSVLKRSDPLFGDAGENGKEEEDEDSGAAKRVSHGPPNADRNEQAGIILHNMDQRLSAVAWSMVHPEIAHRHLKNIGHELLNARRMAVQELDTGLAPSLNALDVDGSISTLTMQIRKSRHATLHHLTNATGHMSINHQTPTNEHRRSDNMTVYTVSEDISGVPITSARTDIIPSMYAMRDTDITSSNNINLTTSSVAASTMAIKKKLEEFATVKNNGEAAASQAEKGESGGSKRKRKASVDGDEDDDEEDGDEEEDEDEAEEEEGGDADEEADMQKKARRLAEGMLKQSKIKTTEFKSTGAKRSTKRGNKEKAGSSHMRSAMNNALVSSCYFSTPVNLSRGNTTRRSISGSKTSANSSTVPSALSNIKKLATSIALARAAALGIKKKQATLENIREEIKTQHEQNLYSF
jgi:hypothetical protein